MDNYNRDVWYIGYPTVQNIKVKSIISMLSYTIFPNFMEKQVSANASGGFDKTMQPTYSSVPLCIFFLFGLVTLILRVGKLKNCASEALLLTWFSSTFILTLVIVKDFSLERYLLPLEISIIFIASYGFWNFIKEIPGNKIKITFFTITILTHSITALSYWQKVFFSPGVIWVNPLHYGTLQESFDNPFTLVANILFVGYLFYMLTFRFQKKRHGIVSFVSAKFNQFGKAFYLKR